ADRRRAAAVGAPSHRRGLGVAVNDLHVADADAEFIRDNLREGRLLALAVWRRADDDVRLAARVETHDRARPQSALEADGSRNLRRTKAADLDIQPDADADVAPFLPRLRLLVAQRGVIGVRQRLVER